MATLVAGGGGLAAQAPGAGPDTLPPLAVGYGVDTTTVSPLWGDGPWRAALPDIYRAWRQYLASRRSQAAADPTPRSPYWSEVEQARWPEYDLGGRLAYQGFNATVLAIRPARPTLLEASPDEFIVKTLFAQVDTSTGRLEVKPVVLTRVYATRENGRWVFSNALERVTLDWPRFPVGVVTYIVHPEHRFDRPRAERAVRFADSLAAAFAVPRLDRLDYYVTDDPDEMYRLLGIDWTITPDPHGAGLASHANRQIFVGAPSLGEEYRHELAHAVLGSLTPPGSRVHPMMMEGLVSWVGGSLGYGPRELRAAYAVYLRAHPGVTLDSVMSGDGGDRGWRPGAAVLFQLAYEHGGMSSVRMLFTAGTEPDSLRATVARALGLPWGRVGALWRERALAGE